MSASLGSLYLELGLDTSSFDRALASVKSQTAAMGAGLERSLKLKPIVNDSALTKLNAHLDRKQQHFQQVNAYLASNPLKPKVDTTQLDALEARVSRLNQQSATVKVGVNGSGDTETDRLGKDIADKVGKSVAKSVDSSGGGLGLGNLLKSLNPMNLVGGLLSSAIGGVGAIGRGALEGVGRDLSRDLAGGISEGINIKAAPLIGSFKLLGRELASGLTEELLSVIGNDMALVQDVIQGVVGKDKILIEHGVTAAKQKRETAEKTNEATRFYAAERANPEAVKEISSEKKGITQNAKDLTDVRAAVQAKVDQAAEKMGAGDIKERLEKTRESLNVQREKIAKGQEIGAELGGLTQSRTAIRTKLVDTKDPAEAEKLQKQLGDVEKNITATQERLKQEGGNTIAIEALGAKMKALKESLESINKAAESLFKAEIDQIDAVQEKLDQRVRAFQEKFIPFEAEAVLGNASAPAAIPKRVAESKQKIKQYQGNQQKLRESAGQGQKEIAQVQGIIQEEQEMPDSWRDDAKLATAQKLLESLKKEQAKRKLVFDQYSQEIEAEQQRLSVLQAQEALPAVVAAQGQSVAQKIDEYASQSQQWAKDAGLALQKGDEDRAKYFINAKKNIDKQIIEMQERLTALGMETPASAAIAGTPIKVPQVEAPTAPTPQVFKEIFQRVADRSGLDLAHKQIPKVVADANMSDGTGAEYSHKANLVKVPQDLHQRLQEGALTAEDYKVLVHESRHAVQYDLGNKSSKEAAQSQALLTPTKDEYKDFSHNIEGSIEHQPEPVKPIARKLEKDAYTFASRETGGIQAEVERGIAQDNFESQFGAGGGKARLQVSQVKKAFLAKLEASIAATTVDVSDELEDLIKGLERMQQAIEPILEQAANVDLPAEALNQLAAQLPAELKQVENAMFEMAIGFKQAIQAKAAPSAIAAVPDAQPQLNPEIVKPVVQIPPAVLPPATVQEGRGAISAELKEQYSVAGLRKIAKRTGMTANSISKYKKEELAEHLASSPNGVPIDQIMAEVGDSAKLKAFQTGAASKTQQLPASAHTAIKTANTKINQLYKQFQAAQGDQRLQFAQAIDQQASQQVAAIDEALKTYQIKGVDAQSMAGMRTIAEQRSTLPRNEARAAATPAVRQTMAQAQRSSTSMPAQIVDVDVQALKSVKDIEDGISKQIERLRNAAKGIGQRPPSPEVETKLKQLTAEVDTQIEAHVTKQMQRLERDLEVASTRSTVQPVTAAKLDLVQPVAPMRGLQVQEIAAAKAQAAINENLPIQSIPKAAKFEAAAARIENKANQQSAKTQAAIGASAGESDSVSKLKAQATQQLAEYAAALKKGLGPLGRIIPQAVENGVDKVPSVLGKLPGFVNSAAKGMLENFGAIAKGFIAFQVVQQLIPSIVNFGKESLNAAMNLDRLQTALDFAGGSASKGAENMRFIDKTVNDLKIPLSAAREGYVTLAAATKDSAIEGKATNDVFEGLSQATTVLGLSSDDAKGAFLALGQMASKGKVQAEELRGQLGERIPGAFQIAARAMGVTEVELNKMLDTGQVVSDEFLPKFGAQLKKEFGGSAVDASKNAQSAMFNFQTTMQRTQESFGRMIQPAQVAGLNAASGAIQGMSDHAAFITPILITIGVTIAGIVIPAVWAAIKAFGALQAETKVLGAGIKAFQASLAVGPLVMFAAQVAAVMVILEVGRNLFNRFVPSDLGNRFKDGAKSIQDDLDKIADKARVARGEISKIPQKQPDRLEDGGWLDNLQVKSDNFFRGAAKNVGVKWEDTKTAGESQFKNDQQENTKFVKTLNDASVLDEDSLRGTLGKTKGVDADLQRLTFKQLALKGAPQQDKKALESVGKEIADKTAERKTTGESFTDQYEVVNKSLKQAKDSIKAIEESNRPDWAKKQLIEPLEKTVTNLQTAKDSMDDLQKSVGVTVDPARKLLGAFEEMNTKIEEINRNAQQTFNEKMFSVNTQALKGFDNDVDASGKAAVAKAEADAEKLKTIYEKASAEQDRFKQEISDPITQDMLKSAVTSAGKGITMDSSVAEIEDAKKRLKDGDSKKDVLDKLKGFREAQDKLTELRPQLPAAELQVKQADQQLTLSQLGRQSQTEESQVKRSEIGRSTGLRSEQAGIAIKRSQNRFYSDADAGVAEANLGIKQAQSQSESAAARATNVDSSLTRLQSAHEAGKISEEEYVKQSRDLGDQLVEARAKASEAEVQIEEAKGKRLEAVNRKRVEQMQEATQTEAAMLQRRQAISNADFATQRSGLTMKRAKNQFYSDTDAGVAESDLGIKQASVQKDFAGQALINANKELQRNSQLYKEGRINAKTFHDQERDLLTKVTEARAHGTEAAAALEEAYAKKIEAVNRQKLEQIEQIQKKALAAIALSATQQTTAIQSDLLNSPDAGELSQAQAGRSTSLIEQSTTAAKIALKQKEIETTKQLVQQGVLNAKEGSDREMQFAQELADFKAAQGQREVQMQGQLRDSRIKLLEGSAKLETEQIDRAKQLLEAQGALAKAQSDLNLARLQGNINQADRAFGLKDRLESQKDIDPRIKDVIAKQLNESGISGVNANSKSYEILAAKQKLEDQFSDKTKEAREQEFELARKSFEFDVKKQEIADKMLVIESKRYKLDADRAKIQAIKDYRQAEKSGDKEGMQLAKASFEIAGNQGQLANEQLAAAKDRLETDKQLADLGRQTLDINQQKAREEAFSADTMRRQNNELSYAEQFVKSSGAIPGRAKGGDVVAGKPYIVGEKGQELFIPKVSGEIIDASKTATILSGQNMQGARQAIEARATGGAVNAGQPYLVGEKGAESFSPSGSGAAGGIGQLLSGLGALITLIGVTASGVKKPANIDTSAAIDTAIRPTITGNGMLDTSIKPTITGNGQLDTAFHPTIAGNGLADTAFHPTVIGAGVNNAPSLGGNGLADTVPLLGGGTMSGTGAGDVSSKLDQLINVVSGAMGRPNLTVSSPQPVNDAAKIYSDISGQQVSNANI